MKYINPNSKSGLVNKFADYIVNKIGHEYKSIIQVVYLGGFFIIKGITESSKVLNLQEIRDSFVEKYQYLLFPHGITNINFIDITQYSYVFTDYDDTFTFYNSDLIRFQQETIDYVKNNVLNVNDETIHYDNIIIKSLSSIPTNVSDSVIEQIDLMSIKSEFPYGYSLMTSRINLFYSEYIINQIFNLIDSDKIIFKYSKLKNAEDDFKIRVITNSKIQEEKISSLILDVFDFNVSKFKNDFVYDLDLEYEIENQLNKPKWLIKDRTEDLILF